MSIYIYTHTCIQTHIHAYTHSRSSLVNQFAFHQLVYMPTPALLPWNCLHAYAQPVGSLHSTRCFQSHQVTRIFTMSQLNLFPNLLVLLLLLSHISRVRLCATPQTAAHSSLDSPGKNTGVSCHFLLQCMKVKSEREVAQSCPTLSNPMDCSLPGSSTHGIFQARVLEWGAIAFSKKGSYLPSIKRQPSGTHCNIVNAE